MPRPTLHVALLTALWRRPEVSRLVLNYYDGLRQPPGVRYSRLAVGSEGEASRRLAEDAGWQYLEAPNEPLSDKWNAGACSLQALEPDAVVIVGSDDLLSGGYFERLPDVIRAGRTFGYLDEVHYYDLPTGRCVRAVVPYVGAGRLLSRRTMDAFGWHPWETGLYRLLDRSMSKSLLTVDPKGRGWHRFDPRQVVCVDLKSDVNLWSFDDRLREDRHYRADGAALLRQHFPSLADTILSLRSDGRPSGNTNMAAKKQPAKRAGTARTGGPNDRSAHHPPAINEQADESWALGVVTDKGGWTNKAYGIVKAPNKGDYFYGPASWIRQLEKDGRARLYEDPGEEYNVKTAGPSATKPAAPTATKAPAKKGGAAAEENGNAQQ